MRKLLLKLLVTGSLLLLPAPTFAQPLLLRTQAGSGLPGSGDGIGRSATFHNPSAVAVDALGNVYVADTLNGTLRILSASNVVSTLAGMAGDLGTVDGNAADARFFGPQGLAIDAERSLFLADTPSSTIRQIAANGLVTTLAGAPGTANSFDGVGTNANFSQPQGVAVDGEGNVYVADTGNHTIRRIDPGGLVTTLAGLAGYSGSVDGTSSKARFNRPVGMALDHATNLYVSDSLNHTIRRISLDGKVSTIAGLPGVWGHMDGTNQTSRFFQPQGIAVDGAGDLFVADCGNQTIRKISHTGTNWVVTTVAGWAGAAGGTDGSGGTARLRFPVGLAVSSAGYLFVADAGNNLVRYEGFELGAGSTLPDGRLQFEFVGKSNVSYSIETSADLVNWSFVTALSSPSGILTFTESAPSSGTSFYRAKISP